MSSTNAFSRPPRTKLNSSSPQSLYPRVPAPASSNSTSSKMQFSIKQIAVLVTALSQTTTITAAPASGLEANEIAKIDRRDDNAAIFQFYPNHGCGVNPQQFNFERNQAQNGLTLTLNGFIQAESVQMTGLNPDFNNCVWTFCVSGKPCSPGNTPGGVSFQGQGAIGHKNAGDHCGNLSGTDAVDKVLFQC